MASAVVVVQVSGVVTETPKSKKVVVVVQVGEKHLLHITEYGGYITAVNVMDAVSKKVLYKSVKYSIQDALQVMKYKTSDVEEIKLRIVAIRKEVKAQYKDKNTVKDYKSLTYSDDTTSTEV